MDRSSSRSRAGLSPFFSFTKQHARIAQQQMLFIDWFTYSRGGLVYIYIRWRRWRWWWWWCILQEQHQCFLLLSLYKKRAHTVEPLPLFLRLPSKRTHERANERMMNSFRFIFPSRLAARLTQGNPSVHTALPHPLVNRAHFSNEIVTVAAASRIVGTKLKREDWE
jgi:hypothetical protein